MPSWLVGAQSTAWPNAASVGRNKRDGGSARVCPAILTAQALQVRDVPMWYNL